MLSCGMARPRPPFPTRPLLTLWVGLVSGAVLCGLWFGLVSLVGWPG